MPDLDSDTNTTAIGSDMDSSPTNTTPVTKPQDVSTKESIDSLDSTDDICIICLDPLTPKNSPLSSTSSLTLPLLTNLLNTQSDHHTKPPSYVHNCECKYTVHVSCLNRWYSRCHECPVCRTQIDVVSRNDNRNPTSNTSNTTNITISSSQLILDAPNIIRQDSDEYERRKCCNRCLCIIGTVFIIYFCITIYNICLLYTSPSPRDQRGSRMPSSA